MADDQNPQDPQVPVSTTDQSASSNTNRPDSTIPAISDQPVATDSAIPIDQSSSTPLTPEPVVEKSQTVTSSTATVPEEINQPSSNISANTDQPVSVSANLSQAPSDQSDQSNSANSANQNVSPPAPVSDTLPPPSDIPPDTSAPDQQPSPPLPASQAPESIPPESAVSDSSTSVLSSSNQIPEVQSETPGDASTNEVTQQTEKMAEIKPDSPQSPAIPSKPPENIPPSNQNTSFGDLLTGNTNLISSTSPDLSSLGNPSNLPVSPPANLQSSITNPTTTDQPASPSQSGPPTNNFSFGDLIKDIKPEESVIQPPPIPSEPTTPPIVSPANPPPISSPSSISPLSPVSPQSDQSVQLDQKLKDELSLRRQKANQKRHQKKEDMLYKLVGLVQTRGRITNREAQKILHLPQSTLTDYFKELVNSSRLKIFGKKRGVYYTV